MKKRTAICGLIVGSVIIGSVVLGTRREAPDVTGSFDVTESLVITETVTETEAVSEEDPYFGLMESEVGCIIAELRRWGLSCSDACDFKDIKCLGYVVKVMSTGELNYDLIEYGVALKDGSYAGVVAVSADELRKCGVDVEERGSCRNGGKKEWN